MIISALYSFQLSIHLHSQAKCVSLHASMSPTSSVVDVAARHWHYGMQIAAGPAYEESGFRNQIDGPTIVRCTLVRPTVQVLAEWATSCMAIRSCANYDPWGGWSPGRSVVAEVEQVEPTGIQINEFYYKLFDFDEADVDLAPGVDGSHLTPESWCEVWKQFIFISARLALCDMAMLPDGIDASSLVPDMISREIAEWNGDIVLNIAKHIGFIGDGHDTARTFLAQWSVGCYWDRLRALARWGDSRVFQLWPNIVVELLVNCGALAGGVGDASSSVFDPAAVDDQNL